jgi:hypothetical protein
VQKPLPIEPDKQRQTELAAEREKRFGPILDAMMPQTVEAICREIFPAWPRIFGPYDHTPQSARRDPVARRLLLTAIADSQREAMP